MIQNTTFKLISELIGRAATFVLTIFAARQLGEAGFGQYAYGVSLGFVVAQLGDMGLQLVITREVAMYGQSARSSVVMALRVKLLLSLLVSGLLVVLTINQSGVARFSLLLLGFAQLANSFLEFAAYVFRGQQNILLEAWLLAGARVSTAVAGLFILWRGGDLLGLATSSLVMVLLFALIGLGLLWQRGWFAHPSTAKNNYRHLLQEALPLGVAIFLSIAYSRLAILLLQGQLGATAVAHYSAAARLVEPTQLIPASLLAAAFPAYAKAWQTDRPNARQISWRVSLLLLAGGVGLTLFIWVTADWLIGWLYGVAFADSVPILRLLALTIPVAFVNYSLTHYLIARGLQRWITLFTAAMLTFHAGLSWYLIPQFGSIAPVFSILVAEGLLSIGCLLVMKSNKGEG